MLMKLINYLHDCFKPPKEYIPMTDAEMKALANLIQVSKERLWMAEAHPGKPEPSFEYTVTLEDSDVNTVTQSLQVVTELLQRHRHVSD